jgi:hypothetical protein
MAVLIPFISYCQTDSVKISVGQMDYIVEVILEREALLETVDTLQQLTTTQEEVIAATNAVVDSQSVIIIDLKKNVGAYMEMASNCSLALKKTEAISKKKTVKTILTVGGFTITGLAVGLVTGFILAR